jgi:hypothetical protein
MVRRLLEDFHVEQADPDLRGQSEHHQVDKIRRVEKQDETYRREISFCNGPGKEENYRNTILSNS